MIPGFLWLIGLIVSSAIIAVGMMKADEWVIGELLIAIGFVLLPLIGLQVFLGAKPSDGHEHQAGHD